MAEEVEIINVGNDGSVASEETLAELLKAVEYLAKKEGYDPKKVKKEVEDTAEALKDLRNEVTDTTDALEDHTDSLKKNTGVMGRGFGLLYDSLTAGMGALSNFARELIDGGSKLTDFSRHVPLIGSQILAPLTSYFDETMDSFRQLSSVGASFNNSLQDLRMASANAYMTLGEFTDFVANNSEKLAALGGTATKGAIEVSRLNKALGSQRQELLNMGFSFAEITESMADYAYMTRSRGTLEQRDAAQVAANAANYAKTLQTLAKLTGKEVDQIKEEQMAAQNDLAFQMRMNSMDEKERAKARAILAEAEAGGPTAIARAKEMIMGFPPMTEETRIFSATMSRAEASLGKMVTAMSDKTLSDDEFANEIKDQQANMIVGLVEAARTLETQMAAGALSGEGVGTIINDILNSTGVDLQKYIQFESEELFRQAKNNRELAEEEANKRGKVTSAIVEFEDAIRNARRDIVTNFIESGVFDLIADSVAGLADMLSSPLFLENLKDAIIAVTDFFSEFIESVKSGGIKQAFLDLGKDFMSMIRDFFMGSTAEDQREGDQERLANVDSTVGNLNDQINSLIEDQKALRKHGEDTSKISEKINRLEARKAKLLEEQNSISERLNENSYEDTAGVLNQGLMSVIQDPSLSNIIAESFKAAINNPLVTASIITAFAVVNRPIATLSLALKGIKSGFKLVSNLLTKDFSTNMKNLGKTFGNIGGKMGNFGKVALAASKKIPVLGTAISAGMGIFDQEYKDAGYDVVSRAGLGIGESLLDIGDLGINAITGLGGLLGFDTGFDNDIDISQAFKDWVNSDTVSKILQFDFSPLKEKLASWIPEISLPEFNWPSFEDIKEKISSWIPEISLPEFEWPSFGDIKDTIASWIPEISLPEFNWPSFGDIKDTIASWIPEISLPEFEWPSFGDIKDTIASWIPEISLPEFTWPSFSDIKDTIASWIPEISLPEFTWPSFSDIKDTIASWIPEISLPEFEWPSFGDIKQTITDWIPTLSDISLPEITIPTFDDIKQTITDWFPSLSNISLPEFTLPTFDDIKQTITDWFPKLDDIALPEITLPTFDDIKQTITDWFPALDDIALPEITLPTFDDIKQTITDWFPSLNDISLDSITIPSFDDIKKSITDWFPALSDISLDNITLPSFDDIKQTITDWFPSLSDISLPEITLPTFDDIKQTITDWFPTLDDIALPEITIPTFDDIKQTITDWFPSLNDIALPEITLPTFDDIKQTITDWFPSLSDISLPEFTIPDFSEIGNSISSWFTNEDGTGVLDFEFPQVNLGEILDKAVQSIKSFFTNIFDFIPSFEDIKSSLLSYLPSWMTPESSDQDPVTLEQELAELREKQATFESMHARHRRNSTDYSERILEIENYLNGLQPNQQQQSMMNTDINTPSVLLPDANQNLDTQDQTQINQDQITASNKLNTSIQELLSTIRENNTESNTYLTAISSSNQNTLENIQELNNLTTQILQVLKQSKELQVKVEKNTSTMDGNLARGRITNGL